MAGIECRKLTKAVKAALVKPLILIINQSLKTDIFPDKLKIAWLYLYLKRMMIQCFQITVQYPCYPQFQKGVFIQLYSYFQVNWLFYNNQYDFREGHSTELAAIKLVDRIFQQIDNGETPFNIYLEQ